MSTLRNLYAAYEALWDRAIRDLLPTIFDGGY